jgi:hypothetical protein
VTPLTRGEGLQAELLAEDLLHHLVGAAADQAEAAGGYVAFRA